MTKEQQFDEELVAKIIAAAEASGVSVRRINRFGVDVYPNGFVAVYGPVCAVGAGVLYQTLSPSVLYRGPEDAFAEMHGVSVDYADGVSGGFESYAESVGNPTDSEYESPADYRRGFAVGEAVRAYFEDVP